MRTIINTGVISGNIAVTGPELTIVGAGAGAFGTLTGGTLSVGTGLPGSEGTVVFDGGKELVNDTIDANVDVELGTLIDQNAINGSLMVANGATLLGEGTDPPVNGNVTISGTYEVSITGENNGTYAYTLLHVTGAGNTVTILPGATLEPVVGGSNLVPGLGSQKLTLITADGGVDGGFSNMTSPGVGTQYILTYDENDVYLSIVPSGAKSPFRAYALTANAGGAANVLDQILVRYPTDPDASTLTSAQTQLIDAATSVPAAQIPQFLTALDGQIHAEMVAVAPQAGQQLEGSVYDHLANSRDDASANRAVWGNVSTQFGSRGTDSVAAGFNSEVTQVLVGADLLAQGSTRLGVGFAHSSGSVSDGNGSGTAQENAGFVYGQLPVGSFEVQGIGSYGAMSTDTQRGNPLGGALTANGVGGNDALVSLGVSRPFQVRSDACSLCERDLAAGLPGRLHGEHHDRGHPVRG